MYKIVITRHFKNQLKKLVKKDRGLKENLKELLLNFDKTKAIALGNNVYKLRLKSLNSGKSGGYRVYIFLFEINGILAPLAIYSKNKKENLENSELIMHLEIVVWELDRLS